MDPMIKANILMLSRLLYPGWVNAELITSCWGLFFQQEAFILASYYGLVVVFHLVMGGLWSSAVVLHFVAVTLMRRIIAGGLCSSDKRLTGQTVIITGANVGIGKETARDMVRRGARVIMACRDVRRAEEARREVCGAAEGSGGGGSAEVRRLDLSNLQSVRDFAAGIARDNIKVHILINNAGVMMCPYAETSDGFELQMGTNHLGHFLLTNLLLPQLMHGEPARVITLSSTGHLGGKLDINNLCFNKANYNPMQAYFDSKLANVLFTRHLAKKLKGTAVETACVHPGTVQSNLARHVLPAWVNAALTPLLFKTAGEGAQGTIHCALTPNLLPGAYYSDCSLGWPLDVASDDVLAEKLWKLSEQLTSKST